MVKKGRSVRSAVGRVGRAAASAAAASTSGGNAAGISSSARIRANASTRSAGSTRSLSATSAGRGQGDHPQRHGRNLTQVQRCRRSVTPLALLLVLVLLPPSEGKAPAPRRGPALDLDRLSFPSLTPSREHLLDLLAETSSRPDALARLGVGESLRADVEANTRLRATPTLPTSRLFTGVLYDALDLAGLDPAARRRAARDVVVLSALWGARPAR